MVLVKLVYFVLPEVEGALVALLFLCSCSIIDCTIKRIFVCMNESILMEYRFTGTVTGMM